MTDVGLPNTPEIQHSLVYTQEQSETQRITGLLAVKLGFAEFRVRSKSLETIGVLGGLCIIFYPALPNLRCHDSFFLN